MHGTVRGDAPSLPGEMKWTNNWSVAATFEDELSRVTNSYTGKGVLHYVW